MLGLPGNPVSAVLCARLFLKPLIAGLLGLPTAETMLKARLETPLPANDHRQEYLRATLTRHPDGTMTTAPLLATDSAMQRTLHAAQALVIRPPPRAPGSPRRHRRDPGNRLLVPAYIPLAYASHA